MRVTQGSGGVAVLDPVVFGFLAGGIAGKTAGLSKLLEKLGSTGDDLVDVSLVAGIPQDDVVGGAKNTVNRQRKFDYA